MTASFECPRCQEEFDVRYDAETTRCPHCYTLFRVNTDSDYRDGRWIILDSLTEIKKEPTI